MLVDDRINCGNKLLNLNMAHYTCKFCNGASKFAGTCQTEGCENKGNPLEECSCGDDSHVGENSSDAPVESPEGEEGGTD